MLATVGLAPRVGVDLEVDNVGLVRGEVLLSARDAEDLDVAAVEVGVDVDAEAVALGRAARGGGGRPPDLESLFVCFERKREGLRRERSTTKGGEKKIRRFFFFFWLGERLPLAFNSLIPPLSVLIPIPRPIE